MSTAATDESGTIADPAAMTVDQVNLAIKVIRGEIVYTPEVALTTGGLMTHLWASRWRVRWQRWLRTICGLALA